MLQILRNPEEGIAALCGSWQAEGEFSPVFDFFCAKNIQEGAKFSAVLERDVWQVLELFNLSTTER